MSLYAKYIKERENSEIVETDYGFATFKIFDNGEVYVVDVYVEPKLRRQGKASELLDKIQEVTKPLGSKVLTTSVDLNANGVENSLNAIYKYGFMAIKRINSMIYFSKEIL